MDFRDYLYLDVNRLEDYLSRLDPGTLEEIRDTSRQLSGENQTPDMPALNEAQSKALTPRETEVVREKTLSISSKHQFSRLYDAISKDILSLGDAESIRRQSIVEVTRDFEPSPVNRMIDSLFQLTELMQGMGVVETDAETQQAIQAIGMLFKSTDREHADVPMVARDDPEGHSILFTAQKKYIMCDMEDFEGEMTLVGKVQQIIRAGDSVDLFSLLKVLPRSFRRNNRTSSEMRNAIVSLFEEWPDELGGALPKEAMELNGPALVVSPLAVFQ